MGAAASVDGREGARAVVDARASGKATCGRATVDAMPEMDDDGVDDDARRARRGLKARETGMESERRTSTSGRESASELRRGLKAMCEATRETPDAMDVFWYELGNASSEPLTAMSERTLDEMLRPYGRSLYAKNARSGGLYKLVRHAATQIGAAGAHATPVSAINVTVLAGTFIKYFIEFASESGGTTVGVQALGGARSESLRNLAKTFEYDARWESVTASGASTRARSPFDDLMLACANTLGKKRVTTQTMALHTACARVLLIACSSQLAFDLTDVEAREMGHPLAMSLLKLGASDSKMTGTLMCSLLRQIVARPPNSGDICALPANRDDEKCGVTRGLVSAFSALFTSRSDTSAQSCRSKRVAHNLARCTHSTQSPLADEFSNLFLALCAQGAFDPSVKNPFREAVKGMRDVSARSSVSSGKRDATLVNFEKACEALSESLSTDSGLLTLYTMLSTNSRFVAYLGSKGSAAKRLVENLIRELYEAEMDGIRHVSQLIITSLLILSQDVGFNRLMQTQKCSSTAWYKERIIEKSSMGSLMFVVLSRALKYNCSESTKISRDLSVLGVIANMAGVTRDISGYAAQRLVNILELLTKKRARLLSAENKDLQEQALHTPRSEIAVCEDFIRIAFEILNCLTTDLNSLEQNPEIVYALMHKEELVVGYRTDAAFAEYVQNIECVMEHYHDAVRSKGAASPMSVGCIKRIISENSLDRSPSPTKFRNGNCSDCAIHNFYPMAFEYVEDEESAPYFMIPYIWGAVVAQSGVYWRASSVALFSSSSISMSNDFDLGASFSDEQSDLV